MYSLIAISHVNELIIIVLPIIVFIAVFGIVGERSVLVLISLLIMFYATLPLFIPLLYLYRTTDCSNITRGEVS